MLHAAALAFANRPPGVGVRTPVVSGKLNGKPRSTRTARKAKHSASIASPRQETSSASTGVTRARANRLDERRFPPPAAADDETGRPFRQEVERLADGGGRKSRERRGAVLEGETFRHVGGEIIAIERFREGGGKIRMVQQLKKPCLVDLAAPREASVAIHVAVAMLPDPIAISTISRPRVEADDAVLAAPPGEIADPAEVEHGGIRLG